MDSKTSLYHQTGSLVPEINFTDSHILAIDEIINRRYQHTPEQLSKLVSGIKTALELQPMYDEEDAVFRERSSNPSDIRKTIKQLLGHLDEAQTIIREKFTLHIEGLVEQHYFLKTRKFLPTDFLTNRGPVEQILHDLEQATADVLAHDIPEPDKKSNKRPTQRFTPLIIRIADSCESSGMKFKISDSRTGVFHKIITWAIKTWVIEPPPYGVEDNKHDFTSQIRAALRIRKSKSNSH